MKTIIKVAVAVTNKENNQILLLKERYNSKDGYKWNMVKGTCDKTAESIKDTAIRECQEEAGIKIEFKNLLGIYDYGTNNKRCLFVFCGETKDNVVLDQKKEQTKRGEDIIDFKWFTKQEARRLSENEFINKQIYRALRDWIDDKSYPMDILKD